MIQTPPEASNNKFMNLLQITEDHKKSLLKLDFLYKKAIEEMEKSNFKGKTPKFYSEFSNNAFNF